MRLWDDDPILNAFFQTLGGASSSGGDAPADLLHFDLQGTQFLATRAKVQNEASLDWSVA